ncbi:MAG: hypothetical protein IJ584_05465, partial [Bacteroidales bacterium]|nr:hypothetical protein [Bacteroidales bacterium]
LTERNAVLFIGGGVYRVLSWRTGTPTKIGKNSLVDMISINMSMLFAGNMLPFVEKISANRDTLLILRKDFPARG